jgi:hypothetical protein
VAGSVGTIHDAFAGAVLERHTTKPYNNVEYDEDEVIVKNGTKRASG